MKLKNIQIKIVVWAGICLLLTSVVIITFSAVSMKNEAKLNRKIAFETASSSAVDVAEKTAADIKAEIEVALDAARTLAQELSGIKDAGYQVKLGRDEVNSLLKILLDRNPQFVGTYTGWEPNAFDGRDEDFRDSPGHDATGRFVPYWNRDANGKVAVEPLLDYEKEGLGDYYLLPKKTKKECILDPYIYPVQGKPTLITSLVAPIMVGETFYGIAGVDLQLSFLQALADNVKDLYGGAATIALISNNGTLAAMTNKPELAGKPLKDIEADFEKIFADIAKGEKKVNLDKQMLEVYVPLKIGRTTTPWSVSIRIPEAKIAAQADAQLQRAYRKMMWLVVISIACAFVGLCLLWFIARSITRPIKAAIESLSSSAEQMSNAAGQVSSASQSLAEGASEQAASIEETSASLEEISSMTRQNAENAGMADNFMKETNKAVELANDSMAALTVSMREISEASEETSKIIKTIDEIAFQTNLLALNAAVEAARAGEAGAGFAVVADEVRNLAMRAADAAKNTTSLIEGTVKKTMAGATHLDRSNKVFSEVAGSTAKVSSLVGEIAAASNEQNKGIGQVNQAVNEMDKVVQRNAATAEESASAAEEMSSQAAQLNDIVSDLAELVGRTAVEKNETRQPATRAAGKTRSPAHEPKRLTHDQTEF
ncbi:MAG: methyl-accepting chemotaxis protein [Desulfobulbaceae bacterium]|nr:methyl-accepting chemotaxis protein [Desulfobulbaceae bacterium]